MALKHLGAITKDLGRISKAEQTEKGPQKIKEIKPTRMGKSNERDCGTQTSPVGTIDNGCQPGRAATSDHRGNPAGMIEGPRRLGKRKEISPLESRVGKLQRRRNPHEDSQMSPNGEEVETQTPRAEVPPQDDPEETGFQV